jgi:TolA-binding protein
MYLKYVSDHPDSPRAAEALYKAAWRMAAAGDMWTADGDGHRAQEARGRATDIAGQLQSKYPQSEYAALAATLVYKVQQNIPIYGSDRE